jgi:hypothetical protein
MAQIRSSTLAEGVHTGEHLISEGNGNQSREAVVIAGPVVFPAGTLLAKKAADGTIAPYDFRGTLTDFATVWGVAYEGVSLLAGQAKDITAHVRAAEVNGKLINLHRYAATAPNDTQRAAAIAGLKSVGIIAR